MSFRETKKQKAFRKNFRQGFMLVSFFVYGIIIILENTLLIDNNVKTRDNKNSALYDRLKQYNKAQEEKEKHQIAGLSCAKYHPNITATTSRINSSSIEYKDDFMVYWSDIKSDSKFLSPFYDENKYLTFEPDIGGWNNIRMAMETMFILAHAMGRTLVLPPEKKMYLIRDGSKGHKTEFSFNDFFHMDSVSNEHEGFNVITMEQFLTKTYKKLYTQDTKEVRIPPHNKLNWDGESPINLYKFLQQVSKVPKWDPNKCLAAFPSSKSHTDVQKLHDMMGKILKDGLPDPFSLTGKPTPVTAPAIDRLRENVASRDELCIYDEELQNADVVHFSTEIGARMLIHFYGFAFFEDWKQDLWSKRFVRDHIRYNDEIMCAASRIIQAINDRAIQRNPNIKQQNQQKGGDGGRHFDAMHIRRGDFQFKETKISGEEMYSISTEHLTPNKTIYIATDEKNRNFFQKFDENYDVVYLDDFKHLIPDINVNYYGMVEQIVCAHSDVFYGTWFSTFSGYINRIRGYLSTKYKHEGYKDGTLKSWYFVPEFRRYEMIKYHVFRKPFYMREFPTSWRNIDQGIEELFDSDYDITKEDQDRR